MRLSDPRIGHASWVAKQIDFVLATKAKFDCGGQWLDLFGSICDTTLFQMEPIAILDKRDVLVKLMERLPSGLIALFELNKKRAP